MLPYAAVSCFSFRCKHRRMVLNYVVFSLLKALKYYKQQQQTTIPQTMIRLILHIREQESTLLPPAMHACALKATVQL